MPEVRHFNKKTGRMEVTSSSVGPEVSDEELAGRRDKEKLTDTSRLGSYRPKAAVEETDPEKMSPLARAAYESKRKKGVTTNDAAAALAKKRSY